MKAAELLVRCLANEGVTHIFGVPGEENLDLVEALRGSQIELVLTRHEQAAAFMAATYGRLTGQPGVCLSTLGPGALNLATGAAYALLGAMPMVLITGQKGIKSSKQARFQIVDVVASMQPLTKASRQIVSGTSIPTLIRDAFRVAAEERPGPVHLELPEDIAAEAVPELAPLTLHHSILPVAHPAAIAQAAAMTLAAQRPLIMLGAAASRPHLAEPLSEFVRRVGIPFCNTQMGKGAVAGGSQLYMGTAALSERDYVHQAIDRADLILAIGHDTVEKPPFLMGSGGPKVIHLAATPAHVEQVYHPDAEVVGDLGPSLAALADQLAGRLTHAQALLPLRAEIHAHLQARAEDDRFPPTPQVSEVFDRDKDLPNLPPDIAEADGESCPKEFRDLGRNGSFLVIRQLEQDVDGFRKALAKSAREVSELLKYKRPEDCEEWIAAKMVGRWKNGSSLVRFPDERPTPEQQAETAAKLTATLWSGAVGGLPPKPISLTELSTAVEQKLEDRPDNEFLYGRDDPQGLRCPLGAHIRRANPRDSFAPGDPTQIAITNRHRLLRRGRVYDEGVDKEKKTGLLFMCLNADLERQFEFVQQAWLGSSSFEGLRDEMDPLGSRPRKDGRFTIPTPSGPILIKDMQAYVTMRGGGYFFLPSQRALRFLSKLRPVAAAVVPARADGEDFDATG